MAAAGPIPEEVADCFTKAGDYGRYVISSGPYMIQGSDALDISSCDTMKALPGTTPRSSSSSCATPTTTSRPTTCGRTTRTSSTSSSTREHRLLRQTKPAQIEDNICGETGKEIKEYTENPDLEGLLKANPDDGVFYIS